MEANSAVAIAEESTRERRQSQGSGTDAVKLRQYPTWLPYLMALCTIVAGVFSSLVSTLMNKQNAPMCAKCKPEAFVGAMLQTQQMFIAELLALVVWAIDAGVSRRQGKAPLFEFIISHSEMRGVRGHWYFWPVCALCDFGATLLVNHAYQFTFAATVEMLRNFMVVGAAVFQMVLIRKAVVVHQWIGIVLITAALILTATPAILHPDADSDGNATNASHTIIGVVLAISGTTIQSFQLVLEELFFRKGRYPPLKAVGVEGIVGLILTMIAWPIYQVKKAEDVNGSWYQLAHSNVLIGITVAYIPCGAVFNICGLGTTKLAGGLLRGVCFAVRAPLVWIVSLIIKWQSFEPYSLVSAIVFALGFTVYCNFYGTIETAEWFRKPVHCCCTNPAFDHEDEDQERALKENHDHPDV